MAMLLGDGWPSVGTAFNTKSALPSALRRQNDAEYNALVLTHLSRSADVSATIGRDHAIDLVVGNRRPNTVHFNLVVVTNDATLGRPTIHQIAARSPDAIYRGPHRSIPPAPPRSHKETRRSRRREA